jgi:hypothetical protein
MLRLLNDGEGVGEFHGRVIIRPLEGTNRGFRTTSLDFDLLLCRSFTSVSNGSTARHGTSEGNKETLPQSLKATSGETGQLRILGEQNSRAFSFLMEGIASKSTSSSPRRLELNQTSWFS